MLYAMLKNSWALFGEPAAQTRKRGTHAARLCGEFAERLEDRALLSAGRLMLPETAEVGHATTTKAAVADVSGEWSATVEAGLGQPLPGILTVMQREGSKKFTASYSNMFLSVSLKGKLKGPDGAVGKAQFQQLAEEATKVKFALTFTNNFYQFTGQLTAKGLAPKAITGTRSAPA